MSSGRRTFDLESQNRFAALSGDYNPAHMDAVAARRTQAGAPIVHGIHSLLWLLEWVCGAGIALPVATQLNVQFKRPIYVGDEVEADITSFTAAGLRARIRVSELDVLVVSLVFEEPSIESTGAPHTSDSVVVPPEIPNDLDLHDMEGLSGRLLPVPSRLGSDALFPATTRYLGARRVAALVQMSCLVGMVVPGRHSLFAGLQLALTDDAAGSAADGLDFSVRSVEPHFRIVLVDVRGGDLQGFLQTISPAPPIAQAQMAHLRELVSADEFRGSTALVIGGSRGLGEVTAKLLAAGGSRVVITYSTGKSDAEAVATQIHNAGAECATAHYDVRRNASGQLRAIGLQELTHIYYFATPAIFSRKSYTLDLHSFADFNLYYIAGFLDLVRTCMHEHAGNITVFYPSTAAIDTRPAGMTEYAMSKAAAEILCADLQTHLPRVRVVSRRLPGLLTDQTSFRAGMPLSDPVDALLPLVRETQAR